MPIQLGRNPIDAVKEIIGSRTEVERTVMTPARTRALAYLEHLGEKYNRPDWTALTKKLPKYWAGEYGWATAQDIAMVKAATATMHSSGPSMPPVQE